MPDEHAGKDQQESETLESMSSESTPSENTLERSPVEGATAGSLGLSRWVQLGFVVAAVALFWLLDKIITLVWGIFAEPQPAVVSAMAAVAALIAGFAGYRNRNISKLAYEIAAELSKVTWPDRKETWASTVVVIVTSVVASVVLGAFDLGLGKLADLIYDF